jgi:hypothetical protein
MTATVASRTQAGNGLAGVRAATVGAGVALALPLAAYASIGSFARYTADDYCWAGVLRTEGFINAQVSWYTGYSPRYAFTFLVNLVELAGPAIVPALPLAAIVVWLVTLTWTFVQLNLRLGSLSPTASAVVLAEVAAFATFQTAPDLPQSLYWQTGMLTYLLPLILATFLVGWIRRAHQIQRLTPWTLLVSGGVTFVGGGLSETYLIPQNVALTLALLLALAHAFQTGAAQQWLELRLARGHGHPQRQGFTGWMVIPVHLAAALAGGVLALVVIVVAPATAYRVGGTPADLWLTLSACIATGWVQVLRLLRFFPLTVLLSAGLPAVLGNPRPHVSRGWFALVTVCALITALFCYFPSFYAQNGNPPARSLIVPGAIFIAYAMFVGYSLQGLAQRLPAPVRLGLTVALALVPLSVLATGLAEQALAAQSAAARWDAEDLQIRTSRDAGQADITVPAMPVFLGEKFVTTDRQNWFNVCVARYYGVRSIATASETS